jgi:hypothetical protein
MNMICIAYDDLEEMVSYRRNVTGIVNTLFISPKGNARHAPRIKIAIDPPDSLDPRGNIAAIDLDGIVIVGNIPSKLLTQVHRFLMLNRAVLLDYWHYRIDTDELRNRLQAIK